MNPIRHFLFVGGPCDGQTLRVECQWGLPGPIAVPPIFHAVPLSGNKHAHYRLVETDDVAWYRFVE